MTIEILPENSSESQVKLCSKCKIEKYISCFHKSKDSKDGLQHKCKICISDYSIKNKGHKREYDKVYRLANKERSKEYRKEYRVKNGDLLRAQSKKHYADNKEKYKRYAEDNKVAIAVRNKEYRVKNSERIKDQLHEYRKKNKIKLAEYGKRYRQTETGINVKRRKNHKRRALKAKAGYEHFGSIHVFGRDGYMCQLCGSKTRPDLKDVHHHLYPNLDHIIPLSKGGDHSMKNTQCLCRGCNMTKFNNVGGDQLRFF